jgi:hypothetical protein
MVPLFTALFIINDFFPLKKECAYIFEQHFWILHLSATSARGFIVFGSCLFLPKFNNPLKFFRVTQWAAETSAAKENQLHEESCSWFGLVVHIF